MSTGTFVTLKDVLSTGEQLFSGSEIILHVDTIKMNGKPSVNVKEKGFQVIELTTADNNSIGSNYNRRKSNASYVGFANPTVTISGMMSETSIGSNTINVSGTDYKVLNPTRLMQLAHSGRRLHLDDNTLVNFLKTADSDSNQYYYANGMPVVISAWSMTPILSGATKGINWHMDLLEDKD